ncbi:MAG: glycosyltransferase family 4 protein [Nitrospirae bacterium]|nr:MAG: glycosyltransferase family 4 protein [Nitrospirota bacterium]
MDVARNHGCLKHWDSEVDGARGLTQPCGGAEVQIGLLTGGADRHYAFGLAIALISKGIRLDFIGSDELDSPELHGTPKVNFLNLRGNQRRDASLVRKVSRVLIYYVRLIRYAAIARPKVFHILWNNKFEFFDRTLLMLYYKLLGKKIALTAHNVNAGRRDSTDTLLNRLTLRSQYRLADHIFVHTEKMKSELLAGFGVRECVVTVIPYGINNAIPDTNLTPDEAKQRLGIRGGGRTLLFFGNIAPYKGLEYLIAAFQRIVARRVEYHLIIAGSLMKGCERYWDEIQQTISRSVNRGQIIQKIYHIPDEETELYFKAADVLILPYRHIFQSGVLFLGYGFGLPVVAADVGSLREDIIEGKTGFVCRPEDPVDLAKAIETYFSSDLYRGLNSRRQEIREYANERHSWNTVGQLTRKVYAELLEN